MKGQTFRLQNLIGIIAFWREGEPEKPGEASPASVLTLPIFLGLQLTRAATNPLWQQIGWPEEVGCHVAFMLQI